MKELIIKKLLSVVQRNYTVDEIGTPLHVKNRAENMFICVLEGSSVYYIDNNPINLKAGDVLFLPKGITYSRTIDCISYRTVFVYFDFEGIESQKAQLFSSLEGIDLAFIKLYKKWTIRTSGHISECMSILYSIYSTLLRSDASQYIAKTTKDVFDKIVHDIADNYLTQPITVTELAKNAGMSEVHFRRCFKKIYNISPQEYIISLHINHAKDLLQYDNVSIERVAQSSGFTDPGYFCRIFKLKTGFTPSEYRKNFGMTD